jgi:hypothetical protein
VSWNGATEVAAWRLEAGAARSDLQPVATKRKTGFETAFAVPGSDGVAVALALDAKGRELGRSNAIRL